MHSCHFALVAALFFGLVPAGVRGQDQPAAPPAPTPAPPTVPATTSLPAIRIVGEDDKNKPEPASPDVVAAPPVGDFLVIPLRVHLLSAPDVAAVDCHLTDGDIERVVGKVNAIWHKAGIHWALDPIVREPAARLAEFQAAREARPGDPLGPFRLLAPASTRSGEGVDVYYIHQFPVNGVFLGNRTAFVQETAKLRSVPGGSDEPLPRVTAHELGHALGLPHRQDRLNLLASGTTGTTLNRTEVDRVRDRAPRIPGTRSVPDLRRALGEAEGKPDAPLAARLRAILGALEPAPSAPANPPAPAAPPG